MKRRKVFWAEGLVWGEEGMGEVVWSLGEWGRIWSDVLAGVVIFLQNKSCTGFLRGPF